MICTTLLVLSSFMVSRSSSKPMVCVSTSSWPTMCDSVDASASGVAESGGAGDAGARRASSAGGEGALGRAAAGGEGGGTGGAGAAVSGGLVCSAEPSCGALCFAFAFAAGPGLYPSPSALSKLVFQTMTLASAPPVAK